MKIDLIAQSDSTEVKYYVRACDIFRVPLLCRDFVAKNLLDLPEKVTLRLSRKPIEGGGMVFVIPSSFSIASGVLRVSWAYRLKRSIETRYMYPAMSDVISELFPRSQRQNKLYFKLTV